jgi:peroxiredoxin Q/BCP
VFLFLHRYTYFMLAHDFTLPDQNGTQHKLSDYRGKWVILYFYPKDDTSGCTKEACSFRDNLQTLASKNVVVLGVSADSEESHQQFIKKNKLNFTLLSDESTEVIKKYNAWGKKMIYGKEITGILRKTYLIDPQGEIAKAYEKVDPENNVHTYEILKDLQQLQHAA